MDFHHDNDYYKIFEHELDPVLRKQIRVVYERKYGLDQFMFKNIDFIMGELRKKPTAQELI